MGKIIKLKSKSVVSAQSIKRANTRAKNKYKKYLEQNPTITYIDGKLVK